MRSSHIHLYGYLPDRNLRTDSMCECRTGPENVEHLLIHLQRYLDDDRRVLSHPAVLEPKPNFTSSTCCLKSRWDGAGIDNETVPKHKTPLNQGSLKYNTLRNIATYRNKCKLHQVEQPLATFLQTSMGLYRYQKILCSIAVCMALVKHEMMH